MKKNSNLEFHIGKETINIVHEFTYLFLKLLQYSSHANKADVVVVVVVGAISWNAFWVTWLNFGEVGLF